VLVRVKMRTDAVDGIGRRRSIVAIDRAGACDSNE